MLTPGELLTNQRPDLFLGGRITVVSRKEPTMAILQQWVRQNMDKWREVEIGSSMENCVDTRKLYSYLATNFLLAIMLAKGCEGVESFLKVFILYL